MNESLRKASEKRRSLLSKGELRVEMNPVKKWAKSPKNRKLAINATCCVCMGGPDEPGWRQEIRKCTARETCPLWYVRPYQGKSDETD